MGRRVRALAVGIAVFASACGSGSGSGGGSHAATGRPLVRPDIQATIDVGPKPCAVASAAGSVWFTDYGTNRLVQVDPSTNRVTGRFPTGSAPCGITPAAGSLWVRTSTTAA